MKKICFITTSRADFGTLEELLVEISKNRNIKLQLIVTGSHSSKIFGSMKEITKKKKYFVKKIKINSNNKNSKSVAYSFSEATKKITTILSFFKPDIFVVFGDRYEMLAAAASAYILRIPIVHIAGGEKTAGSIDEGFRHSITKLSTLHFPVTNSYKKRLLQIGENPSTVFNYGSLNLTKIKKNIYLNKKQLEKILKFKFLKKNLLFTYHPDTVNYNKCMKNLIVVLNSLKSFKNIKIIVTSPNADSRGINMINYIKKFIKKNRLNNFIFFKSLGSQIYLSLLKIVDGVVGNSSSGISEVPFFGIGTVNIGDRQQGRVMTPSIINCPVSKNKIIKSINKLLDYKFKKKIDKNYKIYGDGTAAVKISKKILKFKFNKFEKKIFHDI